MLIHVLTLPGRPERRQRFLDWNQGQPLTWRMVPAVDGKTVDPADLVAGGVLDPHPYPFTPGALGNALSHRQQWLDCAADGVPRVILEDDACLRRDFADHCRAMLPALQHCDLILFGYNTDAPIMQVLPDGDFAYVQFGIRTAWDAAKFRHFAQGVPPMSPPPQLRPILLAWGSLAYAVSPAGAKRLLQHCFPLSNRVSIQLYADQKSGGAIALDGMVNAALQQRHIRALACFPPIARSPHDWSDVRAE